MATPEGKVKAKVNRALLEFGDKIYRFMPVQMGYGAPGLDYFLCVRSLRGGLFIAIETKVKGKKPTPRQVMTMEAICAAGGLAFVVDGDEALTRLVSRLRELCQ